MNESRDNVLMIIEANVANSFSHLYFEFSESVFSLVLNPSIRYYAFLYF